jgi:hypothetical protein
MINTKSNCSADARLPAMGTRLETRCVEERPHTAALAGSSLLTLEVARWIMS